SLQCKRMGETGVVAGYFGGPDWLPNSDVIECLTRSPISVDKEREIIAFRQQGVGIDKIGWMPTTGFGAQNIDPTPSSPGQPIRWSVGCGVEGRTISSNRCIIEIVVLLERLQLTGE